MKGYKEARARLSEIGVSRWDTNPPKDGVISWYDRDNNLVAKGKYSIILSVGPGSKYTMAYDIGIYKTGGFPYVEKQEDGPAVVENITDEEIWARAEEIGKIIGVDFVYNCSTLLVAVSEYEEV